MIRYWVVLIEVAVLTIAMTVMVFVSSSPKRKHRAAHIHNYPPEIQEEYFKTHEKEDVSYNSPKVIASKILAIFVFVLLMAICSWLAPALTFLDSFLLSMGLMLWIGIYDTCILDWVFFANMKRFRLEGTEHMDEAYHQKWFHLKGMLFPGIPVALAISLLVALIIMLVF